MVAAQVERILTAFSVWFLVSNHHSIPFPVKRTPWHRC